MLFAFFLFAFPQISQASSITVGAIELRLGMEKDFALSLLKKRYDIIHISTGDGYFIYEKRNNKEEIGYFALKDNRITYISKRLFFGEDAVTFYEKLYSVIHQYTGEKIATVDIGTIGAFTPKYESREINIITDRGTFYRIIGSIREGKYIYSISECLAY
jgi:hypothetical protein